MEINKPWIIVHEPADGGDLETILAGPEDCNYRHFGLAICDVIRHVANRFDVDEAEVFSWVQREMDDPTTPTQRIDPMRTPPEPPRSSLRRQNGG